MQRFYGYKHWTLEEKSRCFYVGKGIQNRANSKCSRNHKWHAIVKRYGLRVEICVGPISNKEACDWEIELITKELTFSVVHSHNDFNDICCNFTKGGEGSLGHTVSISTREKLSKAGCRHQSITQNREDVNMKRSKSLLSYYAKNGTEALSVAAKQRFECDSEREKQSIVMTQVGQRADVKKKRSELAIKRWQNADFREKMKLNNKKPRKCRSCGEIGHNRRSCNHT